MKDIDNYFEVILFYFPIFSDKHRSIMWATGNIIQSSLLWRFVFNEQFLKYTLWTIYFLCSECTGFRQKGSSFRT